MSKHIFTLQNIVFIFFLIACKISFAQAGAGEEKGLDKLSPKEFLIPTSPLFDLMGAAPSQVARTIDIKDFKVDWSFKNWRLNPNLATEAEAVWALSPPPTKNLVLRHPMAIGFEMHPIKEPGQIF